MIGLTIVVIIVIVLLVTRAYKPYTPPSASPTQMSQVYNPPNPWGWDATHSSVPVEGIDGKCNVYTFAARDCFSPAIIGFTDIRSCSSGCGGGRECLCSPPQAGQTCVDDDQIFASKQMHRCQPNPTDWEIRTSGFCRMQDGNLATPGTVEQYYTPCNPILKPSDTKAQQNNNRCSGSLSLVVFNANLTTIGPGAFNQAQCMQEPNYSITTDAKGQTVFTGLTPLTTAVCDMRLSYKGFPRELFRIQRADYTGSAFVSNPSGAFARIIHRPTSLAVAPTFNTGPTGQPDPRLPVAGGPLQLLPVSTANSGYWWLLIPFTQDPNYVSGPIRLIARPQMVYISDPRTVPSLSNGKAMWTFLTAPGRLSVSPTSATPGGALILKPFITTNGNAPPEQQAASLLAQTQYVDYAIANLIAQGLRNFDFFNPFRQIT